MISATETRLQLKENRFQSDTRWSSAERDNLLSILEGFISREKDSEIQEKAIRALRFFPEPRVEALLLETLNRSGLEPSCLETLAQVGTTRSLTILSRFIQSEKFTLRWEASEALLQICKRLKIPYLEESFEHKVRLLIAQIKHSTPLEEQSSTSEKSEKIVLQETSSQETKKSPTRTLSTTKVATDSQENLQIPVFVFHCFQHPEQQALFFCDCCSQLLCEICGIAQEQRIVCERCFRLIELKKGKK